jgi:uncharacterized membrane protein
LVGFPLRVAPVFIHQLTGHVMSQPPSSSVNRFTSLVGLGHWRVAGIAFVFLWFFLGGIAHFALTQTEMRIVPPYIPGPRAAVLVSGVFELLGAAGLLWGNTRRAAGWGLFALTLAVTPAHFYMLQYPERFGVPYWLLILRLPVQAALLALIAWSTAPPKARPAA